MNRHRVAMRSWRRAPRTPPLDPEARESAMALAVLVGVMSLTAVAMGVVVVVEASNTWADVMVMSAFVIVFGLTKVALANALFYVMVKSDSKMEAESASKRAAAGMVFRRPAPRSPGRALATPIALHQARRRRIGKPAPAAPGPHKPPRVPGGR